MADDIERIKGNDKVRDGEDFEGHRRKVTGAERKLGEAGRKKGYDAEKKLDEVDRKSFAADDFEGHRKRI